MAKPKEKISFYRPHPRVTQDGLLLNQATGELVRPPSRTKQSFVDECDINNILRQYKTRGIVTHIAANAAKGAYEDLPDNIDFQDSMNTVLQAQSAFATLPSKVRNRFENDPAQFLQFMANPDNHDEAVALGLAIARTPPPEVIPESTPTPPDKAKE